MLNIHEARRQKAEIGAAAEQLLDAAMTKGHDLTGDALKQYNAHIVKMRKIDVQIAEHEANAGVGSPEAVINVERSSSMHSDAGRRSGNSLREFYNHASSEVRGQIDALANALRGMPQASANLVPSADGGVIIPSAVQTVLERNYASFAPVISVARIFQTETGETTTFPVLSDSEVAVQLAPAAATGADATVSGDTPPTALTGPALKAWKASSQPVFINRELITDSPIDIVQEIIGALLARIIRWENKKYTLGAGTTEPEGFVTTATAYHAGSVALDLDIPLDLIYSVPPLYRPNGVFMASDTTIRYLRKLKTGISGDKRSLWKDAFEEGNATLGTPAKLHGHEILINNDLDSVASDGTFAGVTPLVFGDFSKMVVRRAENGSPFVRIYEVPAKDGRAAILFRRSDSKLVVSTAISKLVV